MRQKCAIREESLWWAVNAACTPPMRILGVHTPRLSSTSPRRAHQLRLSCIKSACLPILRLRVARLTGARVDYKLPLYFCFSWPYHKLQRHFFFLLPFMMERGHTLHLLEIPVVPKTADTRKIAMWPFMFRMDICCICCCAVNPYRPNPPFLNGWEVQLRKKEPHTWMPHQWKPLE